MSKPRRSLLSRTLQDLRRAWDGSHSRRRQGRELDRRPRFEFLEPRQMLHAGHDHGTDAGEGEDPNYDFNSNFHIHYQLDIVINGDQQLIPRGVGNSVGANSGKFHTHDGSGLIHNHPGPLGRFATVNDFFESWRNDTVVGNAGAAFSSTNILGNVANGTHAVRMYVNGALNTEFQNYEFHDGDKIVISYEPIANTDFPTFEPIANQTVLLGAPLWLGIDGFDPNGGPLTYSVSVANPNLLTASLPSTNQSLKLDVLDFGTMTFQLFDHLAPNVTGRIKELVNEDFYDRVVVDSSVQSSPTPTATVFAGGSGLSSTNDFYNGQEVVFTSGALAGQRARIADYNGTTKTFTFASGAFTAAPAAGATFQIVKQILFHRIVPDFVIQGGDPTGTGAGGSNKGDFDDQFHLDAQHTSEGLLSMAKSSDDTNDSQFFVTDVPTRFLDFNHSIFGRLTDGEEIRNAVNSVPVGLRNPSLPFNAQTNPNDRPLTPVVINSAQIFTDTENAALMLKALPGASGQTSVTLTVTDMQGHSFSRTFQVTIGTDTANGAPFLINPVNVRGVVGQNIQLQLQATDAEGDPNFFDAVKPAGETVNYTLNVNSDTGLVTITPPAGFIGKFNVVVGVRGATATTTSDAFDTQEIEVTVGPAAPTGIDLVAGSDSGDSNSDNITNAASLQFTVSGVTNGALVKLMKGTNVLAQGTATGTTINLNIANSSTLGEGVHGLTATQTVNNTESQASPVLNITLDTTAPGQFTSTPPTEADTNVLLTYNAQHPDEGTTGFKYVLVTPPAGATIDASTGVLTWTPASSQLGAQSFGISAVDAAGNVRTQTLNITVDEAVPPKLEFTLQLKKPDGTALTSLSTGQDFVLHVFARDLRTPARGVFAAYMDILWDGAKAVATGPIQFSTQYGGQQSGSTATAGQADEAGAFAGTNELGPGAHEVFRIPMRATGSGNLLFSADPADVFPAHDTALYGDTAAVPLEEIRYGTAAITINATFNAVNDTFNINEDAQNATLTPLANDTNVGTATNVLTISAVGQTSNGGAVTIATDGKSLRYTPAANFFGTETFTYTAKNQNDETATATITVQVQPQNDPPTAVANTFQVEKNSTANVFDVLGNDTITPDTSETLRVTAVSPGSQGGNIVIGNNGSNVRYTPKANFTGTETFTYTISDRASGGLTSQATVTVSVSSSLPTAVADTATATEDATTPIEINVLANDLLGEGTALTITAVGAGSKNGAISITQNGTRINYTPAANAQGAETFTYTISNGVGTATGTVIVNITNSNDAPIATADTVTGFKNTTSTFDLLANDSSGPDPTENLTIDTVTQPTQGSVQIVENGKKVSYTPPNNFTGTTTFTYTIRDPGGLTAGPVTVTVNVQEFAPSSLSGFVYFDVDNDGVKDLGEQPIGGVQVKLTGTDINGGVVNRTSSTASSGAYSFTNLLPGNYTIQETQPAFTIDGKETAGSQGGTPSTSERIIVTNLAQGTNGANNNFGERGRMSVVQNAGTIVPLTTIRDFFSSRSRSNFALAAFDSSGNELWHTTQGAAWQGFSDGDLALVNNNTQIKIDVTNPQQQAVTSTVATTDPRVELLATQGTSLLFRLDGAPATFNLQPAPVGAAGEGEGEEAPAASFDQAVLEYLYSTLADDEDDAPPSNADWADAADAALAELDS
jgi:cyclophilin family peptidyl-prolyl cis-trans isomerase